MAKTNKYKNPTKLDAMAEIVLALRKGPVRLCLLKHDLKRMGIPGELTQSALDVMEVVYECKNRIRYVRFVNAGELKKRIEKGC